MNSRRPYRTVDHRLPLQRGPGEPLGFVQTVQGKLADLTRETQGLLDRLRYKYSDGVPASYKNETLFRPDQAIAFNVPVPQRGNPPIAAGVISSNVVVPDGITHSVPIIMGGPGVFVARYFNVTLYQRLWGGDIAASPSANRAYQLTIPLGKTGLPNSASAVFVGKTTDTSKWSLPVFEPVASLAASNYGADRQMFGACFFWNLIDRDSGRKLADAPISQQALLPQGYQSQVNGDLFEFETPWLFERASTLEFQFQLTTPILQPDAASGVFPFNWDDRENNGTERNMDVKVRCELHGTKFYSERDTLLREAV